jgi:hypothetical protein
MLALAERVQADDSAHTFLEKLCDAHGGRMPGTPGAMGASAQIIRELRALGLDPQLEIFTMPGWFHGEERVEVIAPFARTLRTVAMAYAPEHARFEAPLVRLGKGAEGDFAALGGDCMGAVGLVEANGSSTRDVVRRAVALGLRGLLITNRVNGGQLLARTGNYAGETLALPVHVVTQEEGLWLGRLLAGGKVVRVTLQSASHTLPVTGANIVVRLAGASPETIVAGAHVDSWDLGQGAIDNGIGIAQLYALARHLRGLALRRAVELVWFDGEELGLWGSRHRAAATRDAPVVAMLNLDMVGVPLAVNALGDDTSLATLNAWSAALTAGGRALPEGVHNANWLGSDHTPFQIAGMRAMTFHGPIPEASVRFYHDFGDTIDKVPPVLIRDSSATIAALVYWLAQEDTLTVARRTAAGTEKLFEKLGADSRRDILETLGLKDGAARD